MKRSNRASQQPATKLFDHIRELQMRLFASVAVMLIASLVIYAFYDPILNFLRAPLNAPLFYNSPAGSFSFVMRICLMGSLIITIPVIVYNIIMFIQPAFQKKLTRRRIYFTISISSLLAIAGAAFAYYSVLPGSLNFFSGFKVTELHAMISADSYLNFVTNIISTFVIVFQLPLIISFIDFIKPIKPSKLIKGEKWVILSSFILSFLAPFAFDLMTTILVALPIIVLYNLSILLVIVQHKISENNIKLGIIAEPKINTNFSLNELAIDSFTSEINALDLSNPVIEVERQQVKTEFASQIKKQNQVQIPDWVIEKKMRQAALLDAQSRNKPFGDMHRLVQ